VTVARLPLLNYAEPAGAAEPPRPVLLRNLALLDAAAGTLGSGFEVLVRGTAIADVRRGSISCGEAQVVDLGGRTLMPGLIDLHTHVTGECFPVAPKMLPSLITAHAARVMLGMLARGFTSIRDAGGADHGHKRAVELGLFAGPRLFVSGRAISQTGGHGDSRAQADPREAPLCCAQFPGIGRIADGVPEVRKAVRDELRMGADQIKVMAGGGVGSVTEPVDYLQYSMEELKAVVDEAGRANKYVMAHAITAESVQRCIEAGVRTIEHGSLIDERTARMMAQAGRYLVPTLTIYEVIRRSGRSLGFSEGSMEKVEAVWEGNARCLALAAAAGVPMGFGTDVARCPEFQSEEFLLRGAVLPAADVIRSATTVAAEILRLPDKLGAIKPGAWADMIAVDGNPLEDLRLLSGQGEHLPLVIANGRVMKNLLQA
jgi:imidazolonepropionase-like amidohydrolase